MIKFWAILLLIFLSLAVFWLGQPVDRAFPQTTVNEAYVGALESSEALMDRDERHVKLNEERVVDLFTHYEAEYLRKQIEKVYEEDTYFRDAFRELTKASEIRDYMLHGLDAVTYCGFEFQPTLFDNGDYFFRWTMLVTLKRSKSNELVKSIGMSHMRFNTQGKVIFHQDYWDPTDLVYHQIPIANRLINYVKGRM